MRVNVVKRGDSGQYRVKVTTKDPETGQWITKWVRGSFATENEAEMHKAELEANVRRGNIVALDRSSVAGFCEEWADLRRAMGKIEPSTHGSYRNLLKRVLKFIGHLPLATLSSKDVQSAYGEMVLEYGKSAAANSHVIFKMAIRDALKTGRLLADPFARVEPPRGKKKRKQTTLTAEQVADFIAAHRDTEMGLMLELLAASGLRIGEATALQWRDFDFARNTIHISRSFGCLPGNKIYLKAPKTEAGIRTISIAPETMARFQSIAGKGSEFVFSEPNPRSWGRRVIYAMGRAGLGQFTTHDLRHAHATFLLKQVPNPKLVSKRLGHSDVRITLGIYAHVMEGDDDELAELASGLIRRAG